jgi:hypothetical protein
MLPLLRSSSLLTVLVGVGIGGVVKKEHLRLYALEGLVTDRSSVIPRLHAPQALSAMIWYVMIDPSIHQ